MITGHLSSIRPFQRKETEGVIFAAGAVVRGRLPGFFVFAPVARHSPCTAPAFWGFSALAAGAAGGGSWPAAYSMSPGGDGWLWGPQGNTCHRSRASVFGAGRSKHIKNNNAATKGKTKSEVKFFVNGLSEAKRAWKESVWSKLCPAGASSRSSASKTCPCVAAQLCLGFASARDQVPHVQRHQKTPSLWNQFYQLFWTRLPKSLATHSPAFPPPLSFNDSLEANVLKNQPHLGKCLRADANARVCKMGWARWVEFALLRSYFHSSIWYLGDTSSPEKAHSSSTSLIWPNWRKYLYEAVLRDFKLFKMYTCVDGAGICKN